MPPLSYIVFLYFLTLLPPCPSICDVRNSNVPGDLLLTMHMAHLRSEYGNDVIIYTDGSKCNDGVDSTTLTPNRTWSTRLPDGSSVFTAELQAALVAHIKDSSDNFVICSNSHSAVQGVCDAFSEHPMMPEIHRWMSMMQDMSKSVRFCLVPSHWGVEGNEEVNPAARTATSSAYIPPITLPYRDYYPIFHQVLKETWKQSCLLLTNNRLRTLKDFIEL